MNPLHALAAAALAAVLAFGGGFVYGSHTEAQARDLEGERLTRKALERKSELELSERDLKRRLGDEKAKQVNRIDLAANAIDSRLRVNVCTASDLPGTTASGPALNDSGTGGRFGAREVNLDDVAEEIKRLGADRDKCAAKVEGLQRGSPGYTDGN